MVLGVPILKHFRVVSLKKNENIIQDCRLLQL